MAQNSLNKKPALILIAGSAGSLQVIFKLLQHMGSVFAIPVVVVMHRDPAGNSLLAELLASKTSMQVKEIEEKEMIQPGVLYVCPADYHVLIESDHSFSLDYSEKVNFSRPSIDVVFRSAADVYGDKVLAILLSGANADGADGLGYIRDHGGIAIVQHPDEAIVSYMPEQAILQENADYVLETAQIGAMLQGLKTL